MADHEKKFSILIRTQHEQAQKGLVSVGGSLTTLGQKAQAAQKSLASIDAFKTLKKQTTSAENAWKTATAEVGRLATAIKKTEAPTRAQVTGFERAKKSAAGLKTEYLKNQQQLQGLRTALKKTGVSTTNLVGDQARLKTSFSQLRAQAVQNTKLNTARGILDVEPPRAVTAEIKKLNAAYARLKTAHAKGVIGAQELATAQSQLKRKTAALKGTTTSWSGSLSKARATLASVAVAGYAVVKSINGFADYNQKMAEVSTLTDASAASIAKLSDGVVEMSTRIPQSAESLAGAEYDILSAGVALADSSKVLEQSAKAAVAGVTDTKTAANVGIGVVNAYGLKIGELGNVYDVLFNTVKRGVTTFPELAQHMGETLPTAKAAGVSYQDVGAAIAELTKAGLRTPQAATALKGAINAMAAPTPEAKKKFAALGITWQGLIPTLEQLAKKNLSLDQMRILIPDVEARTGVLSLTQNLDKLKDSAASMKVAGGSTKAAYDKMKDTPHNQIVLLKNVIHALSMDLGEFAAGALLPAAKALAGFARENKELLAILLGGGGLLFAFKKVTGAIRGFTTAQEAAAATKIPSLLGAGGGINAALLARVGLYGALAFAVLKTVSAYSSMRDAQNEAAKAEDRAALSAARAQGIADAAAESTGLQIDSITELNQMLREGLVVRDRVTGSYKTAAQAQDKATKASQRAAEQEAKRAKSFQSIIDKNAELTAKYGELDLAALETARKQKILDNALAESIPTTKKIKAAVGEAGKAYIGAADAMDSMSAADANYAAAQKDLLAKRTAYVNSVKKLNDSLYQSAFDTYDQEEQALDNSLEDRKLQLLSWRDNDVIDKGEYCYQLQKADEDSARATLKIRQEIADKAKKIYGEDSDQYRIARQDVIDAEHDVKFAVLDTARAFDSIDQAARRSAGSVQQAMDKAVQAAKNAAQEIAKTTDAAEKKGRDKLAGGFYGNWDIITNEINALDSPEALAKYRADNRDQLNAGGQLGNQWSNLLNQHAADLVRQKSNEMQASNQEFVTLPSGQRVKNTVANQRYILQSYNNKAQTDSTTNTPDYSQAITTQQNRIEGLMGQIKNQTNLNHDRMVDMLMSQLSEAKQSLATAQNAPLEAARNSAANAGTQTIVLKAADGRTVTGNYAPGDGTALLDILRQAGMVTA